MDATSLANKIIRQYSESVSNSRAISMIRWKIDHGIATYADAQGMASECGKLLSKAFADNLPEALVDNFLYREVAEIVIQQPMIRGATDVTAVARQIQAALNNSAGIGLNVVTPNLNMDQLNGIITGVCNDPFSNIIGEFADQVSGFFEGHVDDFVHDNAEFQYQAGLSPKIERTTTGRCCKWCDNLAGIYSYDQVRDRGNDVFRRHTNCKCNIIYNPGSAKDRQAARARK